MIYWDLCWFMWRHWSLVSLVQIIALVARRLRPHNHIKFKWTFVLARSMGKLIDTMIKIIIIITRYIFDIFNNNILMALLKLLNWKQHQITMLINKMYHSGDMCFGFVWNIDLLQGQSINGDHTFDRFRERCHLIYRRPLTQRCKLFRSFSVISGIYRCSS